MNGLLHGFEKIFIICVETPEEHTHTLSSHAVLLSVLCRNYNSVYFIFHCNPESLQCAMGSSPLSYDCQLHALLQQSGFVLQQKHKTEHLEKRIFTHIQNMDYFLLMMF